MNTQQAPNMGLQQAAVNSIKNINDYIYKETFKLEKQ